MKIIKITESQLKKVIETIITEQKKNIKEGVNPGAGIDGFATSMQQQTEDWPKRELKRKKTAFRQKEFDAYPREDQIKKLFGPYSEDIPGNVLQYMRKNPQSVLDAFREIYGEKY